MLTVSSYVAPSAIDGLGVFAGEFIRTGAVCMWNLNPKFDIFISRDEIEGYRRICRTSSLATAIRIWKCRESWSSTATTGAS